MKKPAKVDNVEEYWLEPPASPSSRCTYWLLEIERGWRPNRRIRGMGYYCSSEFYGVYIWEYLNRIFPLLSEKEAAEGAA